MCYNKSIKNGYKKEEEMYRLRKLMQEMLVNEVVFLKSDTVGEFQIQNLEKPRSKNCMTGNIIENGKEKN